MTQTKTFGPPWTILKMLEWTTQYFQSHKLESARREAELLLGHCLKMERIMLYARFDYPMEPAELERYRELVKRRARREPMAYITGSRGFWSLELKTDPRALIPRPDTETLIEAALKRVEPSSQATIVDVGTGTGAIALALASEREHVRVLATDISPDALELAKENAAALSLDERVSFAQGDLLEGLGDFLPPKVEMIVSNPPYIGEGERDELMADVRDYEPALALFAPEDGFAILRALAHQAYDRLAIGGHLLCEIGYKQGPQTQAHFEAVGFKEVQIIKDLNGHDRVVVGTR